MLCRGEAASDACPIPPAPLACRSWRVHATRRRAWFLCSARWARPRRSRAAGSYQSERPTAGRGRLAVPQHSELVLPCPTDSPSLPGSSARTRCPATALRPSVRCCHWPRGCTRPAAARRRAGRCSPSARASSGAWTGARMRPESWESQLALLLLFFGVSRLLSVLPIQMFGTNQA